MLPLSDRCQIANGKKIILGADRQLINVPKCEEIIAVLWKTGFCDYLFLLFLLSLRCIASALVGSPGRLGKGRFDDTQHSQDRETLCCSLLLTIVSSNSFLTFLLPNARLSPLF
jgi:hypothetical protein